MQGQLMHAWNDCCIPALDHRRDLDVQQLPRNIADRLDKRLDCLSTRCCTSVHRDGDLLVQVEKLI